MCAIFLSHFVFAVFWRTLVAFGFVFHHDWFCRLYTADGALVVLVSEKYVNTHNQGQHTDNGKNGDGGDNKGLTLYELASVMTGLGCSDAMTVEDYNWSHIVLQDGTDRGKDLFWTNNRWYITNTNANYGNIKPESSENVNLVVACFK